MNLELSKIRKLSDKSEMFNHKPRRIEEKKLLEMIHEINSNFAEVYKLQVQGNIDVDTFVEKTIANIYIVLTMFDEMGIYPDYFYDTIVKMNVDYQKAVGTQGNNLRGNYRLYQELSFSSQLAKKIREGLKNGYYRFQAYPKKDINDAFLEMVAFFQSFGVSYISFKGDETSIKKQCNKIFGEISFNHINIVENLLNSDFLFEDVEYLARLLFEYICFLTAIGINPKERLDEYITQQENAKNHKRG